MRKVDAADSRIKDSASTVNLLLVVGVFRPVALRRKMDREQK